MSGAPSEQFDARSLIEKIAKGEAAREFIHFASQGFLPLPQEELVAVLIYLSGYGDKDIAATAAQTLAELPLRVVLSFARNEDSDPELLGRLAAVQNDPTVLEAILRNRSTSDATIIELARRVDSHLQDVVVINQARIIRAPEIIEALLGNPNLSADVRRRVGEAREEFFEKREAAEKAAAERVRLEEEEALTAAQEKELAELLALAAEQDEENPVRDLEPPPDEDETVWVRILNMNVSEKVQCAFKGDRTERSILVREHNKLVCSAVIRSPKVTESEIEAFAAMRSVEDEVLRLISANRDWVRKYPIMINLVRNPKTPIGVVLPLINRLTLKDLKSLSGDRNVSETVRTSARKLWGARSQK
ncbi:MAG: hypothetical protein WBX15_02315 [Thermoanaerobaculia bacterium]